MSLYLGKEFDPRTGALGAKVELDSVRPPDARPDRRA